MMRRSECMKGEETNVDTCKAVVIGRELRSVRIYADAGAETGIPSNCSTATNHKRNSTGGMEQMQM